MARTRAETGAAEVARLVKPPAKPPARQVPPAPAVPPPLPAPIASFTF
ncbi:MAG TPA: hypothetical protein VMT03_12075 [Polyangia bacterium]|nr:hypothetical protein [Polyangia bacterium]